MSTNERFDESISGWLEQAAPGRLPDRVLEATFERTRGSRQHVGWRVRLGRMHIARSVAVLGGAAAVVTVASALAVGSFDDRPGVGGPSPSPDLQSPFMGTWFSKSDADGGTQTMTVRATTAGGVEITVTDDIASVCSRTPSTMTGTGRLEGDTRLVIPAPVYTCDDGSEPDALSGPPLEEQLRNLTYVLDPQAEVLTVGTGSVWTRSAAAAPSLAPAISDTAWPQSSLEEVRQAQELADAGDPAYAWQVDAQLASDDYPYPWDSEIVERFLRKELGWGQWGPTSGTFGGQPGVRYDEVMLIRCATGRTNPLYPDMPSLTADMPSDVAGDVRGCAPTIDDLRYETIRFSLEQPALRGPSGIWVVSGWEMLQPVEPGSFYEHLYPQDAPRQVVQVAPPSDAEVTALLEGFLQARLDGEGAERYVHRHPDGWDDQEVPILYATTGGSPYVRYGIDRLQGPVWPSGWIEFRIRLFAEDGTEVEQSFIAVRQEDGRLGLMYGLPLDTDFLPTTEDGQSVPVRYSLLDGEVTFAAAPPWGDTILERTSTTLGGVGRGSAVQFTMFTIVADPRTAIGCEAGPIAADAEALVRSIRSNPDLEATAPVAVRIGGIDAVKMDVVGLRRPEVGECMPMVLDRLWAGEDTPMRLYLLDLPEGMSAGTLAIAIVALDSEFEHVVEAAAPVLDSIEFLTR